MSITLNTLRDRVRIQLENAWGSPDPLPVTTSSETLTALRDRVEIHLQDGTNAKWATDDIDEAIEKALEEYNRYDPRLAEATLTLSAAGREVDMSSLTDPLRIHKVWWPYDSTTPGYPPNWVQFDVWPDDILYIDERTEPANGDKVRVWYTTPCLLNGLNSATGTTIPADDLTYLINGAAWYAGRQRALELSEELNVDKDVPKRIADWADSQGKSFRYGVRKREPAWWRHAYAFNQDDIDEAIRWSLGRFNEIAPQEAISSITLTADGREIDLSTITDLLRVTRIWWPYDSSSPVYPPNWVSYETWGDTLFIDSGSEPQSGDVVRVWYVRLATVEDLDSATGTTLPADAESLLITGSVGYVAEERITEKPGWRVPRDLKEWAIARLADFEKGLLAYAKREASQHAGLVQIPAMDRWDKSDDAQW